MVRAVTVNVYNYSELDLIVRERIISRWREHDEFPWGDEWRESVKLFCASANLRLDDWNVGYPGTYVTFTFLNPLDHYDCGVPALSGVRAWKWLMNNGWERWANKGCPFTGYCGDESLLDPIRKALRDPASIVSLYDLFRDCLYSWAHAYEEDYDYWCSREAIEEDITANAYEFYADGRLV